jgi:glutamate racemase
MVAEEYLKDIKKEKVDTLVLGCTHYPLLSDTIRKVMGDEVSQVNSAKELALALKELLEEKEMSAAQKPARYMYYTSDSVEKFKELGKLILSADIENVERVDVGN